MHRHLGSISRLPLLVSAILVSGLTSPLPPASFSPTTWLQYLHVSLNTFLHASCLILNSLSGRVPKIPPASLRKSSCVFISFPAPPLISQELCVSFNIELSLSPVCPSISCIHFASYGLPPLASPPLLTCFNTGLPRHQQLLAFAGLQYLNSPQTVRPVFPKERVPFHRASKNIAAQLSAYNDGVSPPMRKVHEAGAGAELRHN